MLAVKGKYQDGIIHLLESVPQRPGDVLVIFLDADQQQGHHQMMTFGMFSGDRQSTEADFQLAEFSGDPGDWLDWE